MDEQDAKVGASECEQDGYHTTKVTRLLKEKKVLSLLRRGQWRADGKAFGHTSPGNSICSDHRPPATFLIARAAPETPPRIID